jgi:hypothetical protein
MIMAASPLISLRQNNQLPGRLPDGNLRPPILGGNDEDYCARRAFFDGYGE